jgi:hypothetical protein
LTVGIVVDNTPVWDIVTVQLYLLPQIQMYAMFIMDFEWDSEKAEANRRKHPVDFELAAQILFDPHRIEKRDAGHDCGEEC